MTGNQDTDDAEAINDAAVFARLKSAGVRALETIEASELDAQDMLHVQRYSRAIELTARAYGRTIAEQAKAARTAETTRRKSDETEPDVSKATRDDSPENLQRIRDQLMDDFDRVHVLLGTPGADRIVLARETAPPGRAEVAAAA